MIKIGRHIIQGKVLLAPMAGITDLPFRTLCKKMGASLTTSEMLTSDISLWDSVKSKHRLATNKEVSPRSIQLAGSVPEIMAEAARQNVMLGAEIIDINMGCPAKKVLKRAAGSALLQDEKLVERILKSITSAVAVNPSSPVDDDHDAGRSSSLIMLHHDRSPGVSGGHEPAAAHHPDRSPRVHAPVVRCTCS